MGIAPPKLSTRDTLDEVNRTARAATSERPVQKMLVFAPDAIGAELFERHSSLFADVLRYAPVKVRLRVVFPSITPVCFASMFTGTLPDQHGIQKYEKPVLRCDTIFDAMLRAGKRVAIVAVVDSSIERIFRGRELDYFAEPYDQQVTDRVLGLLEAQVHDFIVAYQQQYDDIMHATQPESPNALEALRAHVASFRRLAQALSRYWTNCDRGIAWVTDHGTHRDPVTGKGTHGSDVSSDMEVNHFFGFDGARPAPQSF